MRKANASGIKVRLFESAYSRDLAKFKDKLNALMKEISEDGYWLGYHMTEGDGIELVMLPKSITTEKDDATAGPEFCFENVLNEFEPLMKDGEFAVTLYPAKDCIDETCWVK